MTSGHFSSIFETNSACFGLGIPNAGHCVMNKTTSLYAVAVALLFTGILARIRAAMEKQIPVGYQDENGFHLGNQPTKK